MFVSIFLAVALGGSPSRITVAPAEVRLPDATSRQQLLVTVHDADGYPRDLTRAAKFTSSDPSVAEVGEDGVIRPRRAGVAKLKVSAGGSTAEVAVTVDDLTKSKPVSFKNDVMAILSHAGCNAGTCHGHNSGKGGFKLSLRGYNPAADFAALTDPKQNRIDVAEPDESLILLKPSGGESHRGGKRFEPGSEPYRVLHRWISEGAKSDVGRAVEMKRLEVLPARRIMTQGKREQQLLVLAHFADGTVRDVTHQAAFDLSKEGVVEVDANGHVTATREGEAAVAVRFLGAMGRSQFVVLNHRADFTWRDPPVNNYIDRHIFAKLRAIQVVPSDLSSDAEFLRRVTLDTIGVSPTPGEVRKFLADRSADKRAKKVDELLAREEFGEQWALYWLERSGTSESGDSARFKGMWTLSFWLRDAINRNMRYDGFVRALVASKGSSLENPAVAFSANRLPREEVVPQLFLGVRLECAQCHDHPFDVWRQSDHRAMQEFFTAIKVKEGPHDSYGRELRAFVPPVDPWDRNKKVTLQLPDGKLVDVPVARDRREALADWMFGAGRRQTARSIVNRIWGKYLGRGIIDPVDDMRFSNPAVNEPLLDALADDLIEHQWNFKHLVRTLLNSRTYQLSSVPNPTNRTEVMNFSHAALRRLSAEQLLDSMARVTGINELYPVAPPGSRAVQIPYAAAGSRVLTMFGRPAQRQSPCDCVRSQELTLPQVLHLLNGATVAKRLRAPGGTLDKLLKAGAKDEALVRELFLAVLSRPATEAEAALGVEHLREASDRTLAAEDLLWALLNSQEFLFNH